MQQEEHPLSLGRESPSDSELRDLVNADRIDEGALQPSNEAPDSSRDSETNLPSVGRRTVAYQPMLLVAIAAITGVIVDRCLPISFWLPFGLAAAALVTWFLIGFLASARRATDRRWACFRSCTLLVVIAMIGSTWHHGYWNFFGADEIGRFASDVAHPCCLDATIVSEAKRVGLEPNSYSGEEDAELQTRFSIRVTRLRDGMLWRNVSGHSELIVHDDAAETIRSGDQVRIFGSLVGITPPTNPGQFDFGDFYRGKRKLAFVHAYRSDSVEVLRHSNWKTSHWISNLRHHLNSITWRFVGEQQAPFASAILLGNREQLTKERRDRFVETGTVHLLAISGLHVGILAGAFLILLRLPIFNRRTCLWATIGFVIFYAWLVEFRPPATRASILIVLFCLGRMIGERSFSMNLLAVAALIVIGLNPTDVFAIGPQLSFLAVATLAIGKEWIFWQPSKDPLDRLIANTRSTPVRIMTWIGRQTRTAVLVSSVIWILAMPLVANRFHLVSFSALVINPFLLLPIGFALYAGLGMMLMGGLSPPMGWVCGYFCQRNLAMVEWAVVQAHQLSWGHFWTSGPPFASVLIFYVGAVVFAAFPPTRLQGRWLVLMIAAWVVVGWWLPSKIGPTFFRDRELSCTFLDVGHGTSVLVELPNGENWLYDAGAMGSADYGARNIASALWFQGISRVDAIVISHADSDHFNSLPELLDQFSIDRVYLSKRMAESSSPSVQRLIDQINDKCIAIEQVHAGWRVEKSNGSKDPTLLEVLSPSEDGFGENDNADSIVLKIEYQGRRVLLPGDLEKSGLENLLTGPSIDFDVVLAPHHGSANSDPERFMQWSTPEYVAISGGAKRVSDAVEQRFVSGYRSTVSRTDRDGAIRATLSSKEVRWEHWKVDRWQAVSR